MMNLSAMPKYEAYKDSGVEWLSKVPAQWEVERISSFVTIVNGATPSSGVSDFWDGDIVWITPTDINKVKYLLDSERKITTRGYKSCGTSIISAGSLVVTCRAPIGKVAIAGTELCTNQGCKSIIVKKNLENRFLYYVLLVSSDILNSLGTGTTFLELSTSALKYFKFVRPPYKQQNIISNFLDQKIKRTDEAIAIKEQQIDLLKERKQIIIQQAISQGLDPNLPMKDSGVEWIGQIPEHWEVKRGKYLFDEVDERSKTGGEELLSVSHITGVTPRSEKNVSMFMAEDYTGSKLCRKDDVVINIMWAWMGALGISDRIGIVSPSYGVFRQKLKSSFNSSYLEYLLKSTRYVEYYNKVSTGLHSSRLRFYGHMFFAMKIGCPSIEEQNNIVTYIKDQTKKIDMALKSQQQQIKNLKEYKTTLINSAVTGKIKITPDMVQADA